MSRILIILLMSTMWLSAAASIEVYDMPDSTATDSVSNVPLPVPHTGDYWKRQLRKGKLDLNDESIEYPSFIQFCVDVYRWGDRTFNSYDPEYVVGTGKRCKAYAKNEEWIDTYAMRFPGGKRMTMISNVSANLGAWVSYMAVSLGYSGEVNKLFGGRGTGQRRMEFQFTCALLTAEAYYSKNTGGANIKHFTDYKDGKWLSVKFPGLVRESYGIDSYYFFNHKKYSQGAAYCFSKYQRKSAGSMIAGITVSHQNIGLDFSQLPEDMIPELPPDRMIYRFKYNDYCFLLGYGYNWVFKPNWLFNISVLPSIGFKHCFADNIDGYGNIFSTNVKGKMAVVHNHGRFFYGLGMKMDGHWYKSRNYSFFNSVESVCITAGYRFDIF